MQLLAIHLDVEQLLKDYGHIFKNDKDLKKKLKKFLN
jgi:uncharacterized protein YqgQ